MKSFSNLDINNNQLIKIRIESVSELPTENLVEGRIVYYTTDKKYYYYDGTKWNAINYIELFTGYTYNGKEGENNAQITKASISTLSDVASDPDKYSELMESNKPVSAKQVASTLNNLIYFLDSSADNTKDHWGTFITNKSGELSFIDYTKIVDVYKTMDITKNRPMIAKIDHDGDLTKFPYIIDTPYRKITHVEEWVDVIPTSGCVINSIKNMAENVLGNSTSDDVQKLLVVDRVSKATKLFDLTAEAIHTGDERILTSLGYSGLKLNRRVVDKDDVKEYSQAEEESCPLNDCIPTMSAVSNRDEYTYIVDSDEALEKWLFGNDSTLDYSSVLIKAGEYTLSNSGTVQELNLINTHKISSSGEVTINCPNNVDNVIPNGLFCLDTSISNASTNDYDINIDRLTLKVTGTCSRIIMSGISNITNSTFILDTDYSINPNVILFDKCSNISNCSLKIKGNIEGAAGANNTVFSECINVSNITVYFKMEYAFYDSENAPKLLFMSNCKNISDIYFKNVNITLHGGTTNNLGVRVPKIFTLIQGCENVNNIVVDDYFLDLYKYIFFVNDATINYSENCVISIISECTNISSIIVKNIKIRGILQSGVLFGVIHRCYNVHDCNLDSSYTFEEDIETHELTEESDYLKGIICCIGVHHCNNSLKCQKFTHCAGVERCNGYMEICMTDYINVDLNNHSTYPDMMECQVQVANTSEGGYNRIRTH